MPLELTNRKIINIIKNTKNLCGFVVNNCSIEGETMGRRQNPKTAQRIKELHEEVWAEKEKGVLYFSGEDFRALTLPLCAAARQQGMTIYKGRVTQKNHHAVCPVLFFPEELNIWPCDNIDHSHYTWNCLIIARADYDKEKHRYCVKILKKWNGSSANLYKRISDEAKKRGGLGLPEETFQKLFLNYVAELNKYGMASVARRASYATPGFDDDKKYKNFTLGDIFHYLFSKDFDRWKAGLKVNTVTRRPYNELESLLFSATLFSLCKPLFYMYNKDFIDPDFALRIIVGDGGFPIKNHLVQYFDGRKYEEDTTQRYKNFWSLTGYLRLWCDYRIRKHARAMEKVMMEDEKKTYEDILNSGKEYGKFRNDWAEDDEPAFWKHMGFPLAYSNYHRAGWDSTEMKPYRDGFDKPLTKKRLQEICTANCLPIILPAMAHSGERSDKNCLTISWSLPEDADLNAVERLLSDDPKIYFNEHEKIKMIYYKFMKLLCGQEQKVLRKNLKQAYVKALSEFTSRAKRPTPEERRKACLLAALYFAARTFSNAGIGERYVPFKWHVENVKSMLGCVATAEDFAKFVKNTFKQAQRGKNTVVFYWDEDGIYLYYKEYWDAFKQYCEERGIMVLSSAGVFRRDVLRPPGYICPQYCSRNSPEGDRYDYRKKNKEGIQETVLKVSLSIFAENEKEKT